MILTTLAIAGALGASTLGAGVKVYRDKKREKEYPWTHAAQRLAKKELRRQKKRKRTPFSAWGHVSKNVSRIHASSQAFGQEIMASFVGDSRREQLAEITVSDSVQEILAEKTANRNLKISSVSLLFAAGGTLLYAPLYVPAVIGMLYMYHVFYKAAYEAIVKKRRINGDVAMVIVITGCMVGGFIFITALGLWYTSIMRWLLNKTENHSRKSLINLFGEQPRSVWVVIDGTEVEVPFSDVQSGDQVVVMAGQMIPVDGIITTGMASIDQHQLTGEAQPFDAEIGQSVFASTVVLSGKITVQVEKTGQETVAAQIGQILSNTADFSLSIKSRVESFLDKAVPSLVLLSGASLPWLGLSGALGVLWSCPGYRMFIFGPMSMVNYLHISSRKGILIKDGHSLELLSDIDTIVFDKTGTLTVEQPIVGQILTTNEYLADELLTYAAAAEYRQSHPIALAILQAAKVRGLEVPEIDETHYEIGYGVKVDLGKTVIRVGSERFMQMCTIQVPHQIQQEQARCHAEGYSLVYVAIDQQLAGAIELRPTIRPEAKEVIRTLRTHGKSLVIISGDQEAPTRRLAQELGIDNYFANTLPENKATLVQQLQEEGRSVCFVGDGINDAIALKQAHVSISLRGATTIATDTAQIVLMEGNLTQLTSLFELSQAFDQNIKSSFMMTVIPNLIYIGGAFFFHWGLFTAVIFNACLWLPQLTNVMLPLVKQRETNNRME